jgi:pimeloyl-ACP methyl ester carboxylesterase
MANPGNGLLGAAAATFDRAVLAAVRLRGSAQGSRAERLPHEERMMRLAAIRDAYGATELWASPDAFFVPPPPIAPRLARVRARPDTGGVEVLDASWPSDIEPYLPEVRASYLAHEANRTARARLYLGASPRPAMVLIHGYMAGHWSLEERAWPIAWLARRYDLALALLPFHALRSRSDKKGPPPFPGADPRFTNEGFRQAIFDLRALVRFLRARGAPSVGVMGMSLGGYSTSLLATVESGLDFAVPIIPLASLADFAREQGRLGTGAEASAQQQALEEANRIVSPFARPSLVPKERVLILAAEADRITPIAHAERLAQHFGARVVRFAGGHLLQFGRAEAFRELGRWLPKR